MTPQVRIYLFAVGRRRNSSGPRQRWGTSAKATGYHAGESECESAGKCFMSGDSSKVIYYDMNTGFVRLAVAGSANVTAGNFCSGTSGQKSLSAFGDGFARRQQSIFSNANGPGTCGGRARTMLYLFDATRQCDGNVGAQSSGAGDFDLVRTLGTPVIQNFQVHISGDDCRSDFCSTTPH